jgi:hypothetical protein
MLTTRPRWLVILFYFILFHFISFHFIYFILFYFIMFYFILFYFIYLFLYFVLRWLQQHCSIPLLARNARGETCAHVAALHGNLRSLQLIMSEPKDLASKLAAAAERDNSGTRMNKSKLDFFTCLWVVRQWVCMHCTTTYAACSSSCLNPKTWPPSSLPLLRGTIQVHNE